MNLAVLIVCTGNICRSPAAEALLRAWLPDRTVELMSAGTHAPEGRPIHPLTAQSLAQHGISAGQHVSSQLVPGAVSVADLVLTATRDQRIAVASFDQTAPRRTFTILEFARLIGELAEVPPDPLALRDAAASARTPATVADDLADPITGGAAEHEAMVTLLAPAMQTIADALKTALTARDDAPVA